VLTIDHRPGCADTFQVVTFEGRHGDRMARCKSCNVLAVIEGECAKCGKPTEQRAHSLCPPCNSERKAREIAGRRDDTPTTTTTATVTAPPQGPLTRVCPTCRHRPSRDPRPGSKRGECLPCLQARSNR
jgi:hypothetical protein